MNSRGLSSKISRHFKFVYYGHMHTSDSVDKQSRTFLQTPICFNKSLQMVIFLNTDFAPFSGGGGGE